MKLEALEPALRKAAAELAAPERVMQDIVLVAEAEAKKQASDGPDRAVKTGTWRRSITGVVQTAQRGVVGSNLAYGRFVEEGTKYMEARPAIEDGIKAATPRIMEIMRKAGIKVLEDVANS